MEHKLFYSGIAALVLIVAITVLIYKRGTKNAGYHPKKMAVVYRKKMVEVLGKIG